MCIFPSTKKAPRIGTMHYTNNNLYQNIMNTNEKKESDRETMLATYNVAVKEQYRELRRLAERVERVELNRRFLGDWESNRTLQKMSKEHIAILYKLRHLEEEIDHIRRGRREFDLFNGI